MAGAEDHFTPQAKFYSLLRLLKKVSSVTGRILTTAENAQSHSQGNLALSVIELSSIEAFTRQA